ncbi:MAG: hypothetical protein JO250_10500 [Armatimonadetes bacterium]|nr:hypothetical protein [Armatimonadota bacterium]
MLLKYGLCPDASEALARLCLGARIGQTVGFAAASAGTHAPDGALDGHPYCAATDLHVADLGHAEVRELLSRLADMGFAAFYRRPGFDHWPAYDALHVHAVFAGVKMKPMLQDQIHQWLHGLNGLASRARYEFWQPSAAQCQVVRALFLAHNSPVAA